MGVRCEHKVLLNGVAASEVADGNPRSAGCHRGACEEMVRVVNILRREGLNMKFGKRFSRGLNLAAVLLVAVACAKTAQTGPEIIVYKSPSCTCCTKWASQLRDSGFRVTVRAVNDVDSLREQFAVPAQLAACHTARVGGYTIEGHVPAADIERLLKEHPAIAGLAVPGMPVGSPGMERGTGRVAYDVMTFDAHGKTSVYQSYAAIP